MSKLNEKESIRKSKGVYYTPTDNDINIESVIIAELRLFLCFVEKTNPINCADIGKILNGDTNNTHKTVFMP